MAKCLHSVDEMCANCDGVTPSYDPSPIKRLFHRHEFTNRLTVSGYGYTEYEVWFCKSCPKVFGKQTKGQR